MRTVADDTIDARLTDAWRQVLQARAAWTRCPSTANLEQEQEAMARVDGLLEDVAATMTPAQRVNARVRPLKRKTLR